MKFFIDKKAGKKSIKLITVSAKSIWFSASYWVGVTEIAQRPGHYAVEFWRSSFFGFTAKLKSLMEVKEGVTAIVNVSTTGNAISVDYAKMEAGNKNGLFTHMVGTEAELTVKEGRGIPGINVLA